MQYIIAFMFKKIYIHLKLTSGYNLFFIVFFKTCNKKTYYGKQLYNHF